MRSGLHEAQIHRTLKPHPPADHHVHRIGNQSPLPWHDGELTLQRSVGVVERMDGPGRSFVRDFLLDEHRQFYPLLPFIVAGAVDDNGDTWATLLAGRPGFLQAPTLAMLTVERDARPARSRRRRH